MATYGELITRIATDLERDDLGLGDESVGKTKEAIASAIREYQVRNWWFLAAVATVPTVAAQNYVTRPATIDQIRRASIPSLGVDLCRDDLATLEMYDEPAAQTGQPQAYAEGDGGIQLRLWPTPNAIFAIKLVGTRRVAALALDADSNVWTNEGYDLICAAAKKRLCRFPLRDEAGRALAAEDEALALQALNRTNINRLDRPIRPGW